MAGWAGRLAKMPQSDSRMCRCVDHADTMHVVGRLQQCPGQSARLFRRRHMSPPTTRPRRGHGRSGAAWLRASRHRTPAECASRRDIPMHPVHSGAPTGPPPLTPVPRGVCLRHSSNRPASRGQVRFPATAGKNAPTRPNAGTRRRPVNGTPTPHGISHRARTHAKPSRARPLPRRRLRLPPG